MRAGTLIALSLLIAVPACSPSGEAVRTTICDLSRDPDHFAGKRVEIRSYIESDGFEWTLLKDEACPRRGINLGFANGGENAEMKKVNDALSQPPVGTEYKDVTAVFLGKFQWNPKEKDHHYTMRISVDRIDNLKIVRRAQKRESPYPELR